MLKYPIAVKNIIPFWKPLLWLTLICYGLFLPANELPIKPFLKIPHFDKMVHFSLFFGLCLLLFRPFKLAQLRQYFWAPVISIGFSAVLELVQNSITSSRSSNIYDFLANLSGILVSILFYHFLVSEKKWENLF
jgi:VanZ family protein